MASAKIKTLERAEEEVKKICQKYGMSILDIESSLDTQEKWVVVVKTTCDNDDIYDLVYTRCGFMIEERCCTDLTVFLEYIEN